MAFPHRTNPRPSIQQISGQKLETLERDLQRAAGRTKMAVVIPGTVQELRSPVVRQAIASLRDVEYLSQVVVAVSANGKRQVREIGKLFSGFHAKVLVLWTDDPDLPASVRHPGAIHWLPLAMLVSEGECDVIAVDRCQSGREARHTVASLLHALTSTGLSFVKSYPQVNQDVMERRFTRLFFRPLVCAIQKLAPQCRCAGVLAAVQAPLYGGYALKTRLAKEMRLTVSAGFQTALLSEAIRLAGEERVGELAVDDQAASSLASLAPPSIPLNEMLVQSTLAIFSAIAAEGTVLTSDHMRTLEVLYRRLAEDSLRDYAAAAGEDEIPYNQHHEECAVTRFGTAIKEAVRQFKADPLGCVSMPAGGFAAAASAVGSVRDLCGIMPEAYLPMILPKWGRWMRSEEIIVG